MKRITNKTLLALIGLLLIIVSISSGCIGGKGAGGNQPPAAVQQNQQNVPGVGAIAPDTQNDPQTQIQQTETQEIDKPVLPKSLRALTPKETVEEYLRAGREGRYKDAAEYWAIVRPAKTEYTFFETWPEYGAENKKMEIGNGKKGFPAEIWSNEAEIPIKYEIMIVDVKVYYTTKKGIEKTKETSVSLIKVNNVWKLNNLNKK